MHNEIKMHILKQSSKIVLKIYIYTKDRKSTAKTRQILGINIEYTKTNIAANLAQSASVHKVHIISSHVWI